MFPITEAVRSKDHDEVFRLLYHSDEYGNTLDESRLKETGLSNDADKAIRIACSMGDTISLRYLLRKGAGKKANKDLFIQNEYFPPAINMAYHMGGPETVSLLLEYGVLPIKGVLYDKATRGHTVREVDRSTSYSYLYDMANNSLLNQKMLDVLVTALPLDLKKKLLNSALDSTLVSEPLDRMVKIRRDIMVKIPYIHRIDLLIFNIELSTDIQIKIGRLTRLLDLGVPYDQPGTKGSLPTEHVESQALADILIKYGASKSLFKKELKQDVVKPKTDLKPAFKKGNIMLMKNHSSLTSDIEEYMKEDLNTYQLSIMDEIVNKNMPVADNMGKLIVLRGILQKVKKITDRSGAVRLIEEIEKGFSVN